MLLVRLSVVLLLTLGFMHLGLAQAIEEQPATDINDLSSEIIDITEGRFEQGDELILSMILDRYNLGDIFAVIGEAGLYLEFKPYIDLAEFPIESNAQQTSFRGWFINEKNTFLLDLSNRSVPKMEIAGVTYNLSSTLFTYIDGVLYVHENLFDKWFGVDHDYAFSALRMRLQPKDLLPLQQRLEREKRTVRQFNSREPVHPELNRYYGLLSPQTFDVQLATSYRDSTEEFFGRYSVLGARDVAFLHTNFFIAGTTDDEISDSRLIFSRESLEADLLGIGASRIEFGDIQPVRQGLTRNRSRGLLVSNTLVGNSFDKQQINLVGNLQQGWDVELYRDGVLLDRELDVQSGEFAFLDVPLNFGQNVFDIIKYGPQGQIEKETRENYLDKSTINTRGIDYSISLTENDESVLGTQNISTTIDSGFNFASDISFNAFGNNWGFGLQSDFGGDTSLTSLTANTSRVLGRSFVGSLAFNANSDEQYSAAASISGAIGSQKVNSNLSIGSDESSDEASSRVKSLTSQLRINGRLADGIFGALDHSSQIDYRTSDTLDRIALQNRLGLSGKYGRVFNNIEYIKANTKLGLDEGITESMLGSLSFNSRYKRVLGQLNLGYDALDDFDLRSVSGFLNFSFTNSLRARLSAGRRLDTGVSSGALSMSYKTGSFLLSGNTGYSSVTGWSAGLNANFSLSAQPLIYGDTFHTNRNLALGSSLSVRVFVDENNNFSYDDGELLVPGVVVTSAQSYARAKSDHNGIASLVGMSHNVQSDIEVDVDSFPDPFLKPVIDGVSIRFRRGIADSLDFPLVFTTEIEGSIYFINEDGQNVPATKVPVLLIDKQGKVVSQQQSEFDGYYVLGKVPSGEFSLTIDNNFIEKNNLKPFTPIPISVDAYSADFVFQDVTLERKNLVVGYFATIAEFTSDAQLTLFYKLNRKILKPLSGSLALKTEAGSKRLVSKFFLHQIEVDAFCIPLKAAGLECKVEPHDYFY